jgi:hypothetical protein
VEAAGIAPEALGVIIQRMKKAALDYGRSLLSVSLMHRSSRVATTAVQRQDAKHPHCGGCHCER